MERRPCGLALTARTGRRRLHPQASRQHPYRINNSSSNPAIDPSPVSSWPQLQKMWSPTCSHSWSQPGNPSGQNLGLSKCSLPANSSGGCQVP